VDNISKQQQFNQWSDGHGNSAKTTAIAQLVTFAASAIILAPSTLREFDERFSDVNALMSYGISVKDISGGYQWGRSVDISVESGGYVLTCWL
jgi:hypothetical protein